MAIRNLGNQENIVLDPVPASEPPLPIRNRPIADNVPGFENLMQTIPVGRQVNAAAQQSQPVAAPQASTAPAQPRFTRIPAGQQITLDPVKSAAQTVPKRFTKISADTPIQMDNDSILKMAGKALLRGAGKGLSETAQGVVGKYEDTADFNPNPDIIDQKIKEPTWNGSVKESAKNFLVKQAYNLGNAAPQLAIGGAGAVGGGMIGGPGGALVGGAVSYGAASELQDIHQSYLRGRADGLSHDDAIDRATKETLFTGGLSALAAALPALKFFGKSWQMAGTGADGVAEMVQKARKPISEALTQVFGVQPAVGQAQQEINAKIENKPVTWAQRGENYLSNVTQGAGITGVSHIVSAAFPVKQQVGNPTAAPGTKAGAGKTQPPVMDAEVVTPQKKLSPPVAGQPQGGGAQVEVPLSRDDLAASINNGTPLPEKKVINLPDVPIDPALKAQGYTVGNKVQQVTTDGEVHEGTLASARMGDGELEVTIIDHAGNLRTLFGSDGDIQAAQVPQAQPPAAPVPPAAPEVAMPAPPQVSQPVAPAPPIITPAPPKKPENLYEQMDLAGLKNSLDFVNNHAKTNGGWNKTLSATKRAITEQLDSRFPEWQIPARTEIANAVEEVAPNPTEPQREAGNHKKGHVSIQGIPISLEVTKGSIRSGTSRNGTAWENVAPAHYGMIKGKIGADGENVDVYVGDHPAAEHVYVVDQINPENQTLDEHKVMIAFPTQEDAIAAYQAAFSDGSGSARMGAVTTMSVQKFKQWLRKAGARKAPLAWKAPEPENPKIKQYANELLSIALWDGNLEADKAFQALKKTLPLGEQNAIRDAFTSLYREKNDGWNHSETKKEVPKPSGLIKYKKEAAPKSNIETRKEKRVAFLAKQLLDKGGNAETPKTEQVATENKPVEEKSAAPAPETKNEPAEQQATVAQPEAKNGAVQPREVQTGIPDRTGEKVPAPEPKADAGQKPETAPHGEDGRGGGGVSAGGQLPDEKPQHGLGGGVESGNGNSVQRNDAVPLEPAAVKPKKQTREVAGKTMPEPIGASLQALRRMDNAVSKIFAENPDMSDENFSEVEKYARDVQEEIERLKSVEPAAAASAPTPPTQEPLKTEKGVAMYSLGDDASVDTGGTPNISDELSNKINERLKSLGWPSAKFRLHSDMESVFGEKGVEGAYANDIVHISMKAENILGLINHEVLHALKSYGAFTDAEWKTLVNRAPEWRKKYNIDARYGLILQSQGNFGQELTDKLNEEAIARAIQDHEIHGPVRRLINRAIRFIKAIGDFLRGKGYNFKTAEDVFDAVAKGEVSGRESAKAGREAIQERVAGADEFPKYSLGKAKKASLDEARETLASINGLGRNLTDDLKRVSAAILHPQQIATLHKEFTPVYRAVIERFKQREVNIHNLAKSVDAYNKMPETSKNNVNAALELGRLEGETFATGDDGKIKVKNDGHENAVFSKPDEEITLSPAEAAAYQGVRKAMDDAHDMMLDVILEKFGLLKKGAETIQDVEKMRAAAMKDGDAAEVANLGKALKALNEVADSKKSGYVPFKRWGEIGVSVKNEEGDLVHFERVELPQGWRKKGKIGDNKAVQEAVDRLGAKYNKQGYSINTFEMPKFFDDPATIDLREFDKLLARSEIPAADKEHVREVLQTEMTKRGFSSHFIKAKDTPGYSQDFERAINDYIVKASSYAARVLNERHIEDAVSGITTTGKKNVHDYATKYVDYVNSPEEELSTIRMLGFTWYLAGNISSGIVNLSQPLILTAPWFKASFSHPEIGKAMTKAYSDALKMVDIKKAGIDAFDFEKAPADVRAALIQAYNEGDFLSLSTNDAMAISSTSQALRGLDKKRRMVTDALGATFSIPERLNRVVTFISAYRLAMLPGAQDKIKTFVKNDELGKAMLNGKNSPEAFAFAYAEMAVMGTQFRIGKLNRPQIARGFGSLIFQFQSYTMQALELMYKLNKVHGGKNKKALAAIILAVIALAGMKGPPFEDDAKDLIEALFKFATKRDLDIDTDIREAIIKHTNSPVLAEALIKGVPAAMLNIDLSGRLGFGNIAPDPSQNVLGPWADMLYQRPLLAAKDANEGHYLQALADVSPAFLKNPLTAYQWATDGVRTQRGTKVIDASKVSQSDVALKALGFTSAAIAQKRDEIWAADRANAAVNDLRSSYNKKIARILFARSQLYDDAGKLLPGATEKQSDELMGQVQATMDEINRYNKTVPLYQQIFPDRNTIKQQFHEEMIGAEAKKPRKQDRLRNEEIKKIYAPVSPTGQ